MEEEETHKTEPSSCSVECSTEESKKEENTAEDEPEEILSDEIKQERHEQAVEYKQEGNGLFKESDFEDAIAAYSKGLDICPKYFQKDISVLYSNRAACCFYLEEYQPCVDDATKALEIQPDYQKARLRRAAAYEKLEKLEDALEDYKFILERDPKCQVAGEAVMRLPNEINEKNEKLKAEMMDKLKELGNMVLKPFGLSTNNFKVQQDSTSGGYSVNFQQ